MDEIGHTATQARHERGRTRQLLGMTAVSRELRVARSTAYLWVKAGRLPAIYRGGRLYVPRAALDAFIAAEAEFALENLTDGRRAADEARKTDGAGAVTKTRPTPKGKNDDHSRAAP